MSEENRDEEKRHKILEAAIEEFAENGYEKASTNAIVKRAGVSKGLLFHYFNTKKNLFLAAFDMCMEKILPLFQQNMNRLSSDFIERLIEISLWKVKIAVEYPLDNRFLWLAMAETPSELRNEMENRRRHLTGKYMPLMTENIDLSLFKEDINPQKAIELIMLVTNAYGDRITQMYCQEKDKSKFNLSIFIQEMKIYLDMLKGGIYK